MKFQQLCKQLEDKIQQSYEQGVTIVEAERLAGQFLHAQLVVSEELKNSDLDSRMRKSGLKAVRAAIYMEAVSKSDKKPSDTLLDQQVTLNELVQGQQDDYDKAEVTLASLERYYSIFKEAHIHFRGIAKGKFE